MPETLNEQRVPCNGQGLGGQSVLSNSRRLRRISVVVSSQALAVR